MIAFLYNLSNQEADIQKDSFSFLNALTLEKLLVACCDDVANQLSDNISFIDAECSAVLLKTETKENYSIITQIMNNITNTFSKEISALFHILAHIPEPLKKVATALADEFTSSTNAYVLQALSKGKCSNHDIHLKSLTEAEIELLIETLKSVRISPELKLSCDNIDTADIKKLLNYNQLNHAAIACVTFQQGMRDEDSLCSKLPQEMANKIYSYSYPASAREENLPKFIDTVSSNNTATFFSATCKT